MARFQRCHDDPHNVIQHNDTQHNNTHHNDSHIHPSVNFTKFYEQLLRHNPFAKKLQTQIVST